MRAAVIDGDCEQSFTLTSEPVDGADGYDIQRDEAILGTVADTVHVFTEDPDGLEQEYRVIATAADARRLEPSAGVVAGPCPGT